jgi:uncharacterized membrane protein HdeD (DUF308 family)
VTFAIVAVLPAGLIRRWWAWIPAGVLAVVGGLVLLTAGGALTALNYLWPVFVILAGLFLLWRALQRRRSEDAGAETRTHTGH